MFGRVLILLLGISICVSASPQILRPDLSIPVIEDTLLIEGVGTPGEWVQIRDKKVKVNPQGNWYLKLATPDKPGRYRLKVFYGDSVLDQKFERTFIKTTRLVANMVEKEVGKLPENSFLDPDIPNSEVVLLGVENKSKSLFSHPWMGMIADYLQRNGLKVKGSFAQKCPSGHCIFTKTVPPRVRYLIQPEVNMDSSYVSMSLISRSTGYPVWRKEATQVKSEAEVAPAFEKLSFSMLSFWDSLTGSANVRKVEAGTKMDGEITLSGRFTKERSPFIVDQTLIVPRGDSLVIGPGVEFIFVGNDAGLKVFGKIRIEGRSGEPVIFRSSANQEEMWSGVFIRSAELNEIKHLELFHANVGMMVTDSRVNMEHVRFVQNRFRAVEVLRSEVEISDGVFDANGLLALHADKWAHVRLDGVRFSANGSALAVNRYGYLDIQDVTLERNGRGLLIMDTSAVNVRRLKAVDNKIAVLAENASDVDIEGINETWKNNKADFRPVPIVSLRRSIMFPREEVDYSYLKRFRAQNFISGLSIESDKLLGEFLGSVRAGVEYHSVGEYKNTGLREDVVGNDTIMPGKVYPNQRQYDGWAQNYDVYLMYRPRENEALEVTIHGVNDDWAGHYMAPWSVKWTDELREFNVGDFYENGLEQVFSGEKTRGVRYYRKSAEKTGIENDWEFSLGVGETQKPLGIGEKDPESFGEIIEEGAVRPQKGLIYGKTQWNITENIRLEGGILKGINRVKDLYLRDDLSQDGVGEPMIEGMAAYAATRVKIPAINLQMDAQFAHGSGDTANVSWNRAVEEWIETNNLIDEADSLRLILLNGQRPTVIELEEVLPDELDGEASGLVESIADRSEEISDSLSGAIIDGGFGRANVAGLFGLRWDNRATTVKLGYSYVGRNYFSPGALGTTPNTRKINLAASQNFSKAYKLNFGYVYDVQDAVDNNDDLNLFGTEDGKDSEQAPRLEHSISLKNDYQLNEKTNINLSYDMGWRTQYLSRYLTLDSSSSAGVYSDPFFTQNGVLDNSLWNEFLGLGDTLARGFESKIMEHTVDLDMVYKASKQWKIKVAASLTWGRDNSEFEVDSLIQDFKLKDTTWGKMGYEFHGGNSFSHEYPISVDFRSRKFSNKFSAKVGWESYQEAEQEEFAWKLNNRTEVRFLEGRLRTIIEGGFAKRSVESLEKEWYASQNDVDYRFYSEDAAGDISFLEEDQVGAKDVSSSVETGEYDLKSRNIKEKSAEIDIFAALNSVYYYTPRLFSEVGVRWEREIREDSPAEQYSDLSVLMNLNWEF